jgi:hypothetical protein
MIACSLPVSKAKKRRLFIGQQTGQRLAVHMKDVHDRFAFTDCHLLGNPTDDASQNHSKPCVPQSTLVASRIQRNAWKKHIRCMEHSIQQPVGAIMSSLGETGRTKSLKSRLYDQQYGENKYMDIGKSQRLRTEGNARINKVSAMRQGLARIIGKVCIS